MTRPVSRWRRSGFGPVRAAVALGALAACLALVGCVESAGEQRWADDEADGTGAEPSTSAVDGVELVRLSDGDSGWFLIDGQEVEVRLLGYNAPERFEGDDGPKSCNGEAATQALADLLAAAEVVSVDGGETDRFGRLLVDLDLDGVSAVDRLVADGRGLAIGERQAGRELMWEAAAAGRGLWGDGCGQPAADGLVVTDVEPDPPGRDEEDLSGEWVDLVNQGSESIDLDGWDIRDDSSSHRFDLAGVLGPGERLRIRTGSGSSGDGELFLGSSSPVWSNRGDTVLVIDPTGVVAAWAFVS